MKSANKLVAFPIFALSLVYNVGSIAAEDCNALVNEMDDANSGAMKESKVIAKIMNECDAIAQKIKGVTGDKKVTPAEAKALKSSSVEYGICKKKEEESVKVYDKHMYAYMNAYKKFQSAGCDN